MKESVNSKPQLSEPARILFTELFNNEGMTLTGRIEKALPQLEAYNKSQTLAVLNGLLEKETTYHYQRKVGEGFFKAVPTEAIQKAKEEVQK